MAELTRKELLLALISAGDRPRFSGLDLSGLDLAELDLRGANFINTKLGRADLSLADLSEAQWCRPACGGVGKRDYAGWHAVRRGSCDHHSLTRFVRDFIQRPTLAYLKPRPPHQPTGAFALPSVEGRTNDPRHVMIDPGSHTQFIRA